MNRGEIGAKALNLHLQRALNPAKGETVERHGWMFAAGDKVMQTENDYDKEVYNGDIGFIRSVNLAAGGLVVDFDGRDVDYTLSDLDTLVPAYATTIHKSQGSEFQAVVLTVMFQHHVMLQRNLLYTGITRGKRLVVLLGQSDAVRKAVRQDSRSRRWSKLREWLEDEGAVHAGPGAPSRRAQ